MHFSDTHEGRSSKAVKLAVVAALHVAIGGVMVQNMNIRHISLPNLLNDVTVVIPEISEPPPPEPPKPQTKTVEPPRFIAPQPEVVVDPPLLEPAIQASRDVAPTQSDRALVVQPSKSTSTEAIPAEPGAGIRSAVLADASSCARPDYPARAARNGDTGTVSLALLVGTDGTVTSSRVQRSSGFRELDRAAQQALSLCKFKPAMEGGVPQPGWAQIAYVWTLE